MVRIRTIAAFVTGAAGLLLSLGAPVALASAATPIHMTVPFYPHYPGYNDPGWAEIENATPAGAVTNAIVNFCDASGNGPGCNNTSPKYECTGTVAAGKVVIDSYEGQGGPAFSSWTAPPWMAKYPGDLAVTLATPGQTTSGMQADLAHAQAEGAAYFYEGTDTLYASLPGFFGQEVTAIARS